MYGLMRIKVRWFLAVNFRKREERSFPQRGLGKKKAGGD